MPFALRWARPDSPRPGRGVYTRPAANSAPKPRRPGSSFAAGLHNDYPAARAQFPRWVVAAARRRHRGSTGRQSPAGPLQPQGPAAGGVPHGVLPARGRQALHS